VIFHNNTPSDYAFSWRLEKRNGPEGYSYIGVFNGSGIGDGLKLVMDPPGVGPVETLIYTNADEWVDVPLKIRWQWGQSTMKARIWKAADPEPTTWTLTSDHGPSGSDFYGWQPSMLTITPDYAMQIWMSRFEVTLGMDCGTCFLDTFDRTETTGDWGFPDIGPEWNPDATPETGPRVEPGIGYIIDLPGDSGPVDLSSLFTSTICIRETNDLYIKWSAGANFYSEGGLLESLGLIEDGVHFLWPSLNNDPTPIRQYFSIHAPQVSGLGSNFLYVTTDGAGTGYLYASMLGTVYRWEPITFAFTADEEYNIRISFDGPEEITYYRVKIWPASVGEPSAWDHDEVIAPHTISSTEITIAGVRTLDSGESVGALEARIHRIQVVGAGTLPDCIDPETAPPTDPRIGWHCENAARVTDWFDPDPSHSYLSVNAHFQPLSTQVWVDGLRIRYGADYFEHPSNGVIETLDHIDVGGDDVFNPPKPVWVCYNGVI